MHGLRHAGQCQGEVQSLPVLSRRDVSHARFTYTEVAAILANTRGPRPAKAKDRVENLLNLHDCYRVLLVARQRVVRWILKPPKPRSFATKRPHREDRAPHRATRPNKLIEEAMLAANVCSADFIEQGIARRCSVHEGPRLKRRKSCAGISEGHGGGHVDQ